MTKELIREIFPQIEMYCPFYGSKSTSPSEHFIGKLHGNVKVVFFCDCGCNPERLKRDLDPL
jgi:hypothetical protein